jgi:hypothetical protein
MTTIHATDWKAITVPRWSLPAILEAYRQVKTGQAICTRIAGYDGLTPTFMVSICQPDGSYRNVMQTGPDGHGLYHWPSLAAVENMARKQGLEIVVYIDDYIPRADGADLPSLWDA